MTGPLASEDTQGPDRSLPTLDDAVEADIGGWNDFIPDLEETDFQPDLEDIETPPDLIDDDLWPLAA